MKIIILYLAFGLGFGQDCTQQVISNPTRLPVSLSGSVTINCSRVCGVEIKDRWLLYHKNGHLFVIIQDQLAVKKDFEEITNVTLTLSRDANCSDGRVNYSLHIGSITRKINGLAVQCGALARNVTNIGADKRWEATHLTELVVESPISPFIPLASDMKSEKTVIIGGNITLSCNRVCGPKLIDIWKLYYSDGELVYVNESQPNKLDLKTSTDVFIVSNEDYKGCDGEVVKYSLRIVNITRKVDGLIIECGTRNNDTGEEWYASHSTELKIDNSYRRVLTTSLFNTVVAEGSNIVLNCTRYCDPQTQDRWLLEFDGFSTVVITKENQSAIDRFEELTGMTLKLDSKDCEMDSMEYTLTIGNLNDNVSGLTVTCGVHRTDTLEEWFASHPIKLILENNTEIEMLNSLVQRHTGELLNKTAEIESCKKEREVSEWVTTLLIAVLTLLLGITIITSCVCYIRHTSAPKVSDPIVTTNSGARELNDVK